MGIYLEELRTERYLYSRAHSSIIYNSQKVEATQVPTDRWMAICDLDVQWNIIQPLKWKIF